MAKTKLSKPDYEYWCKFDSWNLTTAAMLLHGIDPLSHGSIHFNTKSIPTSITLKEAHKTFLLFKNVIKDDRTLAYNSSLHPYMVYKIAVDRNLPIPDDLTQFLTLRHDQENSSSNNNSAQQNLFGNHNKDQNKNASKDKILSTRERRTLLKSIALMTLLLLDNPKHSSRFMINGRPNASRITEAVIIKAQEMNVPTEGIKILERKITEALEFISEEEL